jgi:hypothetical protein
MQSALSFLLNGMYTPQVHCMYGTLKVDDMSIANIMSGYKPLVYLIIYICPSYMI